MEKRYLYVLVIALIAIFIFLLLSFDLQPSKNEIIYDPYSFPSPFKYFSMGVASYGLSGSINDINATYGNNTFAAVNAAPANVTAYQVATKGIFGCVKINSIAVNTINSPPGINQYGASLQLNVNLVINASNGNSYTYWLQNTIQFNTAAHEYDILDSIRNLSAGNSPIVSQLTVTGNGDKNTIKGYKSGSIYNVHIYNATYNAYVYQLNGEEYVNLTNSTDMKNIRLEVNITSYNYTLPFTYCPVIKIDSFDADPVVKFGYEMDNYSTFYDNVTFHIPSKNSYLLVTPYKTITQYNSSSYIALYDAEFVFGGIADNQVATFTSLNATGMWLFYQSNNTFVPFPSLYSSGVDTAERAANLKITQNGGYAAITIGTPNLFSNMTLQSPEYNSREYANVASWIENKK